MIENLKKCLDNNSVTVLLTELSKAVGCLLHFLLLAKLHACGFGKASKEYMSHRKQKIQVNKIFSNWANILHGVPEACILGPILSNIFLCDLFLVIPNCDLISYADDKTSFAMDISELTLINEIKSAAETLSFWF